MEAIEFKYSTGDNFGVPIAEQVDAFLKDNGGLTINSTNYTIVQTNSGLLYSALIIYTP